MGLWEHFNKCVGPLHWFVSSFTLGAGNQSQRRCSDHQGDPIQHPYRAACWSLYDVNLSSLALSEYPLPPSIQPSEILPWKVLGVRMLIWSHLNVIKQTRQDKTAWSKMTEGEMLKGMIGANGIVLPRELDVPVTSVPEPKVPVLGSSTPPLWSQRDPMASRKDTFPSWEWGNPCSILHFLTLRISNSSRTSTVWTKITWIIWPVSLGSRWSTAEPQ